MDDLQGEAWLAAEKMGEKRGFPVDFHNPIDQEHILARLYNKLIRFAEKHIRFAIRLDKGWESENPDSTADNLSRLLSAPESFDPAIQVVADQEVPLWLDFVRQSYSQASAYVILLNRFNWELGTLADFLKLLPATLEKRMVASGIHVRHQPSLFDRIEVINQDFSPKVGYRTIRSLVAPPETEQLAWDFA